MRAGLLRDLVEVQRLAPARPGAPVAWEPVHLGVPAEVEYLTGRELFEARSVVERASVRVTIRWLDGLTAAERLAVSGGATLNILAVLPDARRTRMELLCEAAPRG